MYPTLRALAVALAVAVSLTACDDGQGATIPDDAAASDAAAADLLPPDADATATDVAADSAAEDAASEVAPPLDGAGEDAAGGNDATPVPDATVVDAVSADVTATDAASGDSGGSDVGETSGNGSGCSGGQLGKVFSGSCLTKIGTVQICAEYLDLTTSSLASFSKSCTTNKGVWGTEWCPCAGKVAGCSKSTAGATVSSWYYDSAMAAGQKDKCTQSKGTWLTP